MRRRKQPPPVLAVLADPDCSLFDTSWKNLTNAFTLARSRSRSFDRRTTLRSSSRSTGSTSSIDKLVGQLLRAKLSRKTVNNVTAVLSSLMRYAVRNKVIEPFDLTFNIKSQDTEIVAVAADDVDRLLSACTDLRYRAAILLASDAGLRVGEIRALTWPDVNEIAREITVSRSLDRSNALTETKGWERRVIPVSDRLWTALRALDHSRRHVIPRLDRDLPLRYDGVRDAIRDLYARARVTPPPKPWHSLRHTFCTELARAGVPVNVIKELAGHKSIETTLRYMHTDRAAKRSAIDALRRSPTKPVTRVRS